VAPRTLDPLAAREGRTERFDPIECLDQRVRESAAPVEGLAPGRYLLVEGPQRALTIPLGAQALRIGRGLAADLHLDDMSVSRRHAILHVGADGARILDERSSNGTFVNGEAVQQATLRDGDTITLGRFLLRYLELS